MRQINETIQTVQVEFKPVTVVSFRNPGVKDSHQLRRSTAELRLAVNDKKRKNPIIEIFLSFYLEDTTTLISRTGQRKRRRKE